MKKSIFWRRTKTIVAAILVAGGFVAIGNPAGAVHDEGFTLQGDVRTTVPGEIDWVDLMDLCATTDPCTPPATTTSGLPDGFIKASFTADYAEPDPTAYATGTKDIYKIGDGVDGNPATGTSAWQCKSSNNLGPKFDLINAYAAAMRSPANHLIVYFASEILSPNGDRNAGVWLLQDPNVSCTGSGNTNFAGVHKNGDVFIVSAFTNGGTKSNVTVYQWVGNDATGSLQLKFTTGALNDAECDNPAISGTPINDQACAIVNKTAEVNPPWVAPDADGGNLNVDEFYEGAVDLTALGLPECFATVLANSRSSQEPGSTLHDFARGSFQTCNPSTDMTATAATANPTTVHANQTTTLTFFEKNDGDTVLTSPSVSTDDAGCNATITNTAGDANTNGKLDPGETWTFTCTTSFATTGTKTVTAIGHGTSPLGEVTFCATADPTKVCNAKEKTTVTVTVINPSTELTKTASAVITYTFKEKNDGDVALSSPAVADPGCDATPAYSSGDANTNSKLDPGETWTFTCTKTLTGPSGDTGTATYTNVGIGHGTDSAGADVTFCTTSDSTHVCKANERDQVKVTIENLARG